MSQDNQANYARIGFTVMAGMAAIVLSLIYFGGLRGSSDVVYAETYYNRPVNGLSVGSNVNFRGVKVGEVSEISFVGGQYDEARGEDWPRVYIQMALNARKFDFNGTADEVEDLLRRMASEEGLRASVAINGITGMSRIEIDFSEREEDRTFPQLSWTPRHVCIPPKDSLMDSFSVAATKVMNQINRMDLGAFWSNVNSAVEHFSHCAETASDILQSRQAQADAMMENLDAAAASLREAADTIRRQPSALIREVDHPELEETAR